MTSNNPTRGYLRTLLAALCLAATLAAAPVADAQLGAPAQEASEAAPAEPVVHLNTASQAELVTLPGIGPAKAQAILRLRQERGRFKRVEEVMAVRGVGRATFRKLRSRLAL